MEGWLFGLVYAAGQEVDLDDEQLRGALRRAMLLLAAGGDPQQSLTLDGRAVAALAADLDSPERRAQLAAGLGRVREGLDALLADPELVWRAYAMALLAEELAG